jgi:regulator of replication initiation timing
MSTRVTERVDDWTARPFEGGYGELRDLAASEFSGVVRAGGVDLYMTKGTVVGIFGGSIEAFEGGGTVHEAPTPALPLLGVMQERDGEVRTEYYTEETAISEVDEKLSGTGFTGYVELSERVLSGDYYLVYHGGRSMSVAFVGNTGRLLEGEEAFERANGEVGIYSVYSADIDPVGIPEPTAPDSGPGSAAAGAGAGAPASGSPTDETDAGGDTGGESASEPGGEEDAHGEAAEDDTGAEDSDGGERERDANVAEAAASPADAGGTAREETAENAGGNPGGAAGSADGTAADPAESEGTVTADTGGSTAESGDDGLETRPVPSPDSDRTQADAVEAGAGDDAPGSPDSDTASSQSSTAGEGGPGPTADAGDGADRLERLETELEEREAEVDRLEEELQSVTEDRDELAVEVERLEAELERPDSPGTRADAERRLGPEEALKATDIFVRYRSKGDATLAKARDGGGRREDLVGNLLLETHTQFDAGAAAVDGRDYGEFLEDTVEHQFLEWLTEDLVFEIRETGNADPLATLYGALPEIDRVELRASVDLDTADDRETEQFDLVCRDRMGDPLAVVDFNDSREAATESMMEDLVTAAERVGRASDGLAAAFLVTTSFFEPGALETASEATRGGLLNRSKHKSFVNLSRKRGYHLCLVEARGGKFNLTVPEL